MKENLDYALGLAMISLFLFLSIVISIEAFRDDQEVKAHENDQSHCERKQFEHWRDISIESKIGIY